MAGNLTPSGVAAGYRIAPPATAFTIEGTVTLDQAAALPAARQIAERTACGETRVRAASLGAHGGLAGAVVWIEAISQGKTPLPAGPPAVLAMRDCALGPPVLLLPRLGATLALVNDDQVRHELAIEWLAGAAGAGCPGAAIGDAGAPPPRTIPMPLEGQRFELPLDLPGCLVVRCTLHAAERALVVAPAHPYHALTDADGRYRLEGVPPGHYRIAAWHAPLAEGAAAPAASAPLELTAVPNGAITTDLVLR